MKGSILKRARILAMLFLANLMVAGLAGSAWAQYQGGMPWQVGDVIICFGSGTCNVVRVSGTPTLLDQFSDGLPGDTRGVAINNTLHAVATDNGSGTGSNVVVYSIASVDPFMGTKIAHAPVGAPFNGSSGTSSNAQAVAVDSVGHIFVGNAVSGSGQASVVELNPNGSFFNSFLISSGPTPAWVANNAYALNATVLDPNGHVQKVTTAGTSGPALPPFNQFTSAATDGLTWTNMGPPTGPSPPAWAPSTPYFTVGQQVLDSVGNGEAVATVGTSGPGPATPTGGWNATTGGTTIDNAVTWTDQGTAIGKSCIDNQLNSLDLNTLGDSVYFTSGPGGIIQKVTAGLTTCTVFADFGPNVTLHGIRVVPAGSLPTNCNSLVLQNAGFQTTNITCPTGEAVLVVASGTQFVDESCDGCSDLPGISGPGTGDPSEFSAGEDVFDICTGQPAAPGPSSNSCALLLDGGGNIVARYPISTTSPVGTLQALTLDPLVSDCSAANSCTTTSPVPPPKVGSFWIGDNQSPNFYRLDFATGTPSAFNANADCSTHTGCNSTFASIQGLGIYGGEGANQPNLTKLFTSPSVTSGTTTPVKFPLPTDTSNTNTMLVTINAIAPLSLYASLLPQASSVANGGNNSGASDNGFSCEPTTSNKANCIVWKVDTGAPRTATIATKFSTVNTMAPTIDFNTDVFMDENYDVTTFVGNLDPGGGRISVHSLHEVASFVNTPTGSCAYTSPAPKCFQNPGNITFKFSCPTFTGSVGTLAPRLQLVTPPPGNGQNPIPIPLTPTGSNFGNYRFNGTQWIFNWQAKNGTFRATTVELSHQVQTFFEDFTVANSCSTSVTISSVTPNSGTVNGGTKVTIVGVGYVSGATVTFGGTLATGIKVASNGKSITAITPAAQGLTPGPVDVKVTNPGSGGSATFFGGFTYQ